MQLAGFTMILTGYLTTWPELVRSDYGDGARVRVSPMSVGTGHGFGIVGAF